MSQSGNLALSSASQCCPADLGTRLSRRTWLGWGIASFPSVIFNHCAGVLLLRFMTDSLAITAATAASIFAIVKIWDAIVDPSAGVLCDTLAAHLGTRLPCVLVGGLLSCAMLMAIFAVPEMSVSSTCVYLTVTLLMFVTACSVFKVSYVSMAVEIAGAYHERTRIMTSRVTFASIGTLVGLGLSPILLASWGTDRGGYMKVSVMLAITCAAVIVVCVALLRDASGTHLGSRTTKKISIRQLATVLHGGPFLWLAATKVTYYCTLALTIAGLGFLTKYVLGRGEAWLGVLLGVYCIGSLFAQPFWARLARQHGKRTAFMMASGLCAMGWFSWYFVDATESSLQLCLRAMFVGFASGGTFLLSQSMLPDTVEYEARRIDTARHASIMGVLLMIEQVSWALGLVLLGSVLSISGYLESNGPQISQPDSAIAAIKACVSLIPALLQLLGILAIARYDLTESALEVQLMRRGLRGLRR
jgi:glycoside/pentoside/hexuronide:cation symporter, GPH family